MKLCEFHGRVPIVRSLWTAALPTVIAAMRLVRPCLASEPFPTFAATSAIQKKPASIGSCIDAYSNAAADQS